MIGYWPSSRKVVRSISPVSAFRTALGLGDGVQPYGREEAACGKLRQPVIGRAVADLVTPDEGVGVAVAQLAFRHIAEMVEQVRADRP